MVVGHDLSDDAAVVRLEGDERRGLVLTADIIAPLVDDPETFGAIAATNALSDVYAMGGRPLYALALAFFPDEDLPLEILAAILRGGMNACARLGVAVVGGHTVRDPELKYGLSVTGEVQLDAVLSNQTAQAGQSLVLTKALGTGVIGSAIKKGVATAEEQTAAITSMTTANAAPVPIARRHGVTACTDVTGFGLLGHLRNILRGSKLCARIDMPALPLLPGALEHARAGRVPGGSKANLAFLESCLRRTGVEDQTLSLIAADAQTSGGLLLCVPAERADALVAELRAASLPAAAIGGLHAPDDAAGIGTIELSF